MAVLLAALVPAGRAEAAETRILISNFRFCIERPFPCDPLDVGYLAGPDGAPAAPVYSPITTAAVRPGDTVTWVYADDMCDALEGCARHEVWLNDGTKLGETLARSGDQAVTWTVPPDAEPGSTIPYFCAYNSHYLFGMTGALQVEAEVEPY